MCCGYSDDARAGVRVFSTTHGWYLCGRRARQPTLADVSKSATAAMLTVKRAQYMSVMYVECSNTHPGPFQGPNGSAVDSLRARGHQRLTNAPAHQN